MYNFKICIKKKLIEFNIKRNRLLGKLGLLPPNTISFGTIKDIPKLVNSSSIHIQLNKSDINNKDYLFSVLELLEKNDISFTLIEFDKILSTADIKQINNISKSANIDFRHVYPNFGEEKILVQKCLLILILDH